MKSTSVLRSPYFTIDRTLSNILLTSQSNPTWNALPKRRPHLWLPNDSLAAELHYKLVNYTNYAISLFLHLSRMKIKLACYYITLQNITSLIFFYILIYKNLQKYTHIYIYITCPFSHTCTFIFNVFLKWLVYLFAVHTLFRFDVYKSRFQSAKCRNIFCFVDSTIHRQFSCIFYVRVRSVFRTRDFSRGRASVCCQHGWRRKIPWKTVPAENEKLVSNGTYN